MNTLWILLVNLLLPASSRRAPVLPHRDISTTQGQVRGYLVHGDFYAYLGIPYAQTSTHNRFQAPKAPRSWDSIFEATHLIKCPQSDGSGDENCLAINVFTPAEGASLPVLVYVHGGDFQSGWGPTEPMKLILRKKIINVTFNYRLGPLGFLCLQVAEVPGNAGLKDQVAALYWIHRNINRFGGNPSDITVYGTESGAISIQILILSGLTEGLFHKVILEGGSVLSPASMAYNPIDLAFKAARSLGYDGEDNNTQIADYFLKLTLKQIINVTGHFLPCVEVESYYAHSLIDSDPYEILQQGKFQNVPMIITYTDRISFDENYFLNTVPENFKDLLPSNLHFPEDKIKQKIADIVKGFYINENEDFKKSSAKYMDDVLVNYPTVKIATMFAFANTQPVYLIKTSLAKDPVAYFPTNNCDSTVASLLYEAVDGNEWIQETTVTLISNFIKLGDPTPLITSATPVICQPIKRSNGRMYFIPQLMISSRLKLGNAATQQILFWNHIYNKFYKTHRIYENDDDEDEQMET